MYSTEVFLYTQRQNVVLLSGQSERHYMPQYAKPLMLHKGVDNQIQFRFLNQEQKGVDITDKAITCRVLNADATEILLTKTLTLQLPLTGIATLEVSATEMETISAQKCHYSIEIPSGEFNYPVYVDQSGGGRGFMQVVDSILPSFIPSIPVSIPTGQAFPALGANVNSPVATFYSSVMSTHDNVTTLQATYTAYSGTVKIQGSTLPDAHWYEIETMDYEAAEEADKLTDVKGYTILGVHPYVRIEFATHCGNVTNLLFR